MAPHPLPRDIASSQAWRKRRIRHKCLGARPLSSNIGGGTGAGSSRPARLPNPGSIAPCASTRASMARLTRSGAGGAIKAVASVSPLSSLSGRPSKSRARWPQRSSNATIFSVNSARRDTQERSRHPWPKAHADRSRSGGQCKVGVANTCQNMDELRKKRCSIVMAPTARSPVSRE